MKDGMYMSTREIDSDSQVIEVLNEYVYFLTISSNRCPIPVEDWISGHRLEAIEPSGNILPEHLDP